MSDAQERIITFGMLTDKEQDALRSSDDAYREQTIDLRQRLIETSLKRKSRIEELEAKLAKAVGALESLIQHTHNCEEELTEDLYHADFCGESEPLTKARATLAELSSVSCANLKGQDSA